MRIVTYNVNGLRPRVSQYGSLLKFLNSLEADIICIQETKLSRQEISADLFMAEGYEAFFSCTRTSKKGRISYSGVVTFCRVNSAFSSSEVALPIVAEEGFTGLLSKSGDAVTRGTPHRISLEGLEEITEEDLLKVDSEGRCIITDHGHFVLFNIYGPRAESHDMERLSFKRKFFKILQRRWETLLSEGRRVFVVGDLNIAPTAMDRWDAGPDFEENPFRKWLRSIFTESGGPFFDVFRAKHPQRRDAYTCWAANNGAEEFDCGSRIDLILIAGPCLHHSHEAQDHNFVHCHVKDCDILKEFKRWKSGNIPRGKGVRSVKLEGSDHVPVYVCLDEMPNLPIHSTPSLAARYVPEVRGWQQTIASLLLKREEIAGVKDNGMSLSTSGCSENNMVSCSSLVSINQTSTPIEEAQGFGPSTNENLGCVYGNTKENPMVMIGKGRKKLGSRCSTAGMKKARHGNSSQLTLKCFFQKENPRSSVDVGSADNNFSLSQVDMSKETDSPNETCGDGEESSSQDHDSQDQAGTIACHSSEKEKNNPLLEWQRIQELMQNSVPLCKGHGEACVARSVKKAGPNVGRGFYVCARAEGPASNPEANCGHFQWASTKSKQKRR
ncbi:hypothetical protein AAC387_Pa11g1101 [Persea americana]